MRLKKITVNGRHLSAMKDTVQQVNRVGSGPSPELAFETMDMILKAMEENKRRGLDVITLSSGYQAEIREPECGGTGPGLVLAFGCWELGNLEAFKSVYDQLKELNKDPVIPPAPGIFELTPGIFLRLEDQIIVQCDEDGVTLGGVMSLEDAKKALVSMEYRRGITIPEAPRNVTITGIGDKVQLTYACQVLTTERVKEVLEELSKPVEAPSKTAEEKTPSSGC